jgi:predicted nucleic acid-binding protein
MKPYADTNFLARLYLDYAETDEALKKVRVGRPDKGIILPIVWLHRVEMTNTFQFYAFLSRQGRLPRVTPESAHAANVSFHSDVKQSAFLGPASLILGDLEAKFEELSLRHTAKYGFRTYDVLHVASALLLGCDEFWSFDEKALKLASLEGLSAGV